MIDYRLPVPSPSLLLALHLVALVALLAIFRKRSPGDVRLLVLGFALTVFVAVLTYFFDATKLFAGWEYKLFEFLAFAVYGAAVIVFLAMAVTSADRALRMLGIALSLGALGSALLNLTNLITPLSHTTVETLLHALTSVSALAFSVVALSRAAGPLRLLMFAIVFGSLVDAGIWTLEAVNRFSAFGTHPQFPQSAALAGDAISSACFLALAVRHRRDVLAGIALALSISAVLFVYSSLDNGLTCGWGPTNTCLAAERSRLGIH